MNFWEYKEPCFIIIFFSLSIRSNSYIFAVKILTKTWLFWFQKIYRKNFFQIKVFSLSGCWFVGQVRIYWTQYFVKPKVIVKWKIKWPEQSSILNVDLEAISDVEKNEIENLFCFHIHVEHPRQYRSVVAPSRKPYFNKDN